MSPNKQPQNTDYIKADETWLNTHWRPTMGWTYIAICIFDFIVAPIFTFWFFGKTGAEFVAWKALTMSEGGLFHISMGAILGITAWSRGQEKMTRYRYGGYSDDNGREDYAEHGQGYRDYRNFQDTADYRDYRDTADYRDSIGKNG